MHVVGLTPDIEHIAKNYNTDVADLTEMHANGVRAWSALKAKYPQLEKEVEVEFSLTGKLVKGTADVFSHSDSTNRLAKTAKPTTFKWQKGLLIIIDWKFGHSREHHPNQLKSYGLAAVQQYNIPPEREVLLIEVWVRHGEFHEVETTAKDLLKYGERLEKLYEQAGTVYRPGSACTFCPLATTCTARGVYLGNAAAIITGGSQSKIGRVALGSAYAKVQSLKKAIRVYEDTVKAELANGDITTEDGTLSLVKTSRASLKPSVAAPILINEYGVSREELVDLATIPKKKALDLVRGLAAKGKKKELENKAMHSLEDAGAFSYTHSTKVVVSVLDKLAECK
jgi:hypothetical protein